MKVLPSARRRGIAELDMLHAHRHRIRIYVLDEGLMIIGASRSGALLEIGTTFDEHWIFHAMPARRRFLTNIGHQR